MVPYRKTPRAAREVGIKYFRLIALMRTGRLEPPARDDSGDYVWTEADMKRLRAVLASQAKKPAARV
jgi:hypothetical protein